MKKFFRVEHRFLVPGHSYLPCDQKFGNIETRLRRECNIASKPEYVRIIKGAVKGGFEVVEMEQKDFLNFKVLQDFITKRSSKSTNLLKTRVIIYDINYMEGITLKESYDLSDTEDEHRVKLSKGRAAYSRQAFNLSETSLSVLYNAPIALTKDKLQDLKDLLPFIAPMEKQAYLKNLIERQENGPTIVLAKNKNKDKESDGTTHEVDSLENVLDY